MLNGFFRLLDGFFRFRLPSSCYMQFEGFCFAIQQPPRGAKRVTLMLKHRRVLLQKPKQPTSSDSSCPLPNGNPLRNPSDQHGLRTTNRSFAGTLTARPTNTRVFMNHFHSSASFSETFAWYGQCSRAKAR